MSLLDRIVKFSNTPDVGKFQNIMGSVAMGLSCMAFTGSVLFNNGVPKEQKEFLVSQEIADGVVNVALFFTLTSKANTFAKKLVETGKCLPSSIRKEVDALKKDNIITDKANFEEIQKHLSSEAKENLTVFKKSFPAVFSLGGSLLAASIVTPIIRNIVAAKFQKRNDGDKNPTAPVAVQRSNSIQRPLQMRTQMFNGRTQGMRI